MKKGFKETNLNENHFNLKQINFGNNFKIESKIKLRNETYFNFEIESKIKNMKWNGIFAYCDYTSIPITHELVQKSANQLKERIRHKFTLFRETQNFVLELISSLFSLLQSLICVSPVKILTRISN